MCRKYCNMGISIYFRVCISLAHSLALQGRRNGFVIGGAKKKIARLRRANFF